MLFIKISNLWKEESLYTGNREKKNSGGEQRRERVRPREGKAERELRREATGDRVRRTPYKNTKREEEEKIRKERIDNNRKEKWKGIISDKKDSL